MVNSTRDPGGDGDNDLTRQLQDAADLEALKLPMSPDDATGAPEPGTDARAVWRAVAVCIDRGLPFPDWAGPYLQKTAGRVQQITAGNRAPSRDEVVWAVDLSPKWCKVPDPLKDLETVYHHIQNWIDTKVVAGSTAGVRLYIEKILKDPKAKDETVRHWFKEGRKIVEDLTEDPENAVAFDQMNATRNLPRTLKSPVEIARRKAMLSEPHAVPLAEFVQSLREQGHSDAPDFDPMDGGIRASALLLFEKPGPKASASGFISRNNNDKTAENTFNFMIQAGLPREDVCIWNVVPGWNGTTKVSSAELKSGVESLKGLFALLPKLRVVVFVGRKAERARPLLDDSGLVLLESVHPSPKNYALARDRWETIPAAWARVKEFLA